MIIYTYGEIGIINPYRYRSYRYDTETGLYYLNLRYYNPEWGRRKGGFDATSRKINYYDTGSFSKRRDYYNKMLNNW